MNFTTKFKFGERVHIDDDTSITATVTAFCFRSDRCEIEASWMHNGAALSAWFVDWRLKGVAPS